MVSLASLLTEQRLRLAPSKSDLVLIQNYAKTFILEVNQAIKKSKIQVKPFIGGSFARGTLLKKDSYEADVFMRFNPRYGDSISNLTEKLVKQVCSGVGWTFVRVHGSRDYFKITPAEGIVLEIVPVFSISKPSQEKNITDLSYFHVAYIKKYLGKYSNDVLLAKQFCRSLEVYGAESYIHGFSGYGLECLVLYYKGFVPLLRAIARSENKIILDPAHHYKKNEILLSLNESKSQSPIVLVDPTYKERNVLAALNQESFERFRKAARVFLQKPSRTFFELKKLDLERFEKKARQMLADYIILAIETDRPAGDIAGTKLKKFYYFLLNALDKKARVISQAFDYSGDRSASIHLVLKSRGSILVRGPPVLMKEHVAQFKKEHPRTFVKAGRVCAQEQAPTALTLLEQVRKDTTLLNQMAITKLSLG